MILIVIVGIIIYAPILLPAMRDAVRGLYYINILRTNFYFYTKKSL